MYIVDQSVTNGVFGKGFSLSVLDYPILNRYQISNQFVLQRKVGMAFIDGLTRSTLPISATVCGPHTESIDGLYLTTGNWSEGLFFQSVTLKLCHHGVWVLCCGLYREEKRLINKGRCRAIETGIHLVMRIGQFAFSIHVVHVLVSGPSCDTSTPLHRRKEQTRQSPIVPSVTPGQQGGADCSVSYRVSSQVSCSLSVVYAQSNCFFIDCASLSNTLFRPASPVPFPLCYQCVRALNEYQEATLRRPSIAISLAPALEHLSQISHA